jgi:ribose-phosphate pyrophosphokinase
MILNLDKNFIPLKGKEIQFESFIFSGGEPHIKIDPSFDVSDKVTITHRLNSFNDLGLLCMAVDALRRMEAKIEKLVIPYFPAARQDRVMIKGEPLSVKVYAEIINNLKFERVIVFDAHSEVTSALLNNCEVITNHKFIKLVIDKIKNDLTLVSPDGGALKKIYKLSEFLGGAEVVECSKSRDVKTGKLSGFKVNSTDLQGMNCLVVDDICDGGGTFIGLADALKEKNAGKLYLAVSHGIFSKGFDQLNTCFDKIYSTNSFQTIEHECMTQFDLKDIL